MLTGRKCADLLTDEVINDTVVNVSSVVSVQQHLPLVIKEVDGTASHDLKETLV